MRIRRQSKSTITKSLAISTLASCLVTLNAEAANDRPFRGSVGVSVLLCKYSDSPTPPKTRDFYDRLSVRSGTGAHADYWEDVSYGSINMNGSAVRGWYTIDKTIAQSQAYGGGGPSDRIKKFTDCRDKAAAEGYSIPADHVTVAITSPGIDTFGFGGGAFLGDGADAGVMAHEVGHGMNLNHSFSDDPAYQNATWSAIGEYDDQWDVMSYANVFSTNIGEYGFGGPGPNAYHRDRMGWLARNKIYRFGADARTDRTITLGALNRKDVAGYHMIRIPFDVNNPYRYFTIEYRMNENWDSGFPNDIVLIHEIKERDDDKYYSFLLRDHDGTRAPKQSINRDGVRIDVVSTNPATGQATVRIRSAVINRCVPGFVWREARASDRVCVSGRRRAEVREENRLASTRREPGGGAYGPDTCRSGFVWREAFEGDHACVRRESRTTARRENQLAFERRLGGAVYGPNTCKSGFVWREADIRDWVCVTAERRSEIREENRLGSTRRQPGGGAYGPDTCRSGFVWRDAFPNDHVCVDRNSRTKARQENEQANDRLAKKGA